MIQVGPYLSSDEAAVKRLNRRLAAAGSSHRLPESHLPSDFPPRPGATLYSETILIRSGKEVRGGYTLKHQPFSFSGRIADVPLFQHPVSEGIADRSYRGVGLKLYLDAAARSPVMYAAGIGTVDDPLTKLLEMFKWRLFRVPFYFKVLRPFRFLRMMSYLRRSPLRRALMDIAAFTGAGPAAFSALRAVLDRRRVSNGRYRTAVFHRFGAETDNLWEGAKRDYKFIAAKDSLTMNALYPDGSRFLKTAVLGASGLAGWFVLLDTRMSENNYFGNLRVGTIVDGFAGSGEATQTVEAAATELERRGVDLIVANFSHAAWREGFSRAGFLQGPSNFLFGASRALQSSLSGIADLESAAFVCRGDGDGPQNL